jgi:hypothetical protein
MKKTIAGLFLAIPLLSMPVSGRADHGGGLPLLCFSGQSQWTKHNAIPSKLVSDGEPPLCFPGQPGGCPKGTMTLQADGEPPLCFPGQPQCPRGIRAGTAFDV